MLFALALKKFFQWLESLQLIGHLKTLWTAVKKEYDMPFDATSFLVRICSRDNLPCSWLNPLIAPGWSSRNSSLEGVGERAAAARSSA